MKNNCIDKIIKSTTAGDIYTTTPHKDRIFVVKKQRANAQIERSKGSGLARSRPRQIHAMIAVELGALELEIGRIRV